MFCAASYSSFCRCLLLFFFAAMCRTVPLAAVPSLKALYLQAFTSPSATPCTKVTLALTNAFVASEAGVDRYRHMLSYEGGRYFYPPSLLPPTFLQAEMYPLQFATMLEAGKAPLSAVQVRNQVLQHRPISVDEPLEVACTLECATDTQFDVTTTFASQGSVVSQCISTYDSQYLQGKEGEAQTDWESTGTLALDLMNYTSIGRAYWMAGYGPFGLTYCSDRLAQIRGQRHAELHLTWVVGRILTGLAGNALLTLADERPLVADFSVHRKIPSPSRILVMVAELEPSGDDKRLDVSPYSEDLAHGFRMGVVDVADRLGNVMTGALRFELPNPNVDPQ